MRIELIRPGGPTLGWPALEAAWRTLEAEADGSLFQSWTWLGCRVEQRFIDPLLVRATEAGRVVGLALFNRTGPPLARSLRLHETGVPAEDSVFVEHNGPLVARGRADLLRPMLAAALRQGRLVLSGVDDDVLRAARDVGACHVAATRPAPFVRLAAMAGEADWLAGLSASTRYRLRRSRRSYEAAGGAQGRLEVRAAADVAQGLDWLDALAALHQATWTGRGQPGAFAEPAFVAFHRALLARGLPRGEVEVLQICAVGTAGYVLIGNLYNLRWRDRIYAYQNGFNYAAAAEHQLPGLTCHHAAIVEAHRCGAGIYDFMAGDARYKASLSNASMDLHWLQVVRPGSSRDVLLRIRAALRGQVKGGKQAS
jgi:CelD/BcsL family acetyltransferase involved in cellulose biosynthesis